MFQDRPSATFSGSRSELSYHHRVPRPPLDAFVASIWLFRDGPRPHALERILPTGTAELIVNLKEGRTRLYDPEPPHRCIATAGTILSGVQSRYRIIDTAEQEYVAGVAFRPGGTAAFVGAPGYEIGDAVTPLASLWGRRPIADLREQLLESDHPDAQLDMIERALSERLRPAGVHPAITFALAAFDQAPLTATIGSVTDAIGMSAKRFIERFKSEVGVSPKRFCRIRRFQRALARAHGGHPVDWPQVALESGYYDQAHFIHEFRSFSGLTPRGYQASQTAFQNHVKFLQSSETAI